MSAFVYNPPKKNQKSAEMIPKIDEPLISNKVRQLETGIGSQLKYILAILRWKKTFFVAGLIVVAFLAGQFLTNQFCLDNIRFEQDYPTAIVLDKQKREELSEILSQSFTYLDRGKQSYVFLSADGQYVLKFFDATRLRPSLFLHFSGKKLRRKYARLLKGYEVAYLRNRENTEIVFAKLGQTPSFDAQVHLIDRFGWKRKIALHSVPFIIQKRAIPTRVLVSGLLDLGEVEAAKVHFRKIVDMYVDEYRKGLRDLDHNFMYNTGFIGDRPIRMDVGQLVFSEQCKSPKVRARVLHKILARAGKWLHRHYPHYAQEILTDIQEKIEIVS